MEIRRYCHSVQTKVLSVKVCLVIQVVDAELERLGVLSELTSASLERLETIPVDIRPCYPLAGETCDNTRDNNGNNGGSGNNGSQNGWNDGAKRARKH